MVCDAETEYENSNPDDEFTDTCVVLQNLTDPYEQQLELSSSFIRLNIYYESLNYETIVQSDDYPVSWYKAKLLLFPPL